MRNTRFGRQFVYLFLFLLTACGGGLDELATGSLQVVIGGLPQGIAADVRVSSVSGLNEKLQATQTLEGLPVGDYAISAERVEAGGVRYTPQVLRSPATVTRGETATAQVRYQGTPIPAEVGNLALTITGLPEGLEAEVVVTGPGGFRAEPSESQAFPDLIPGNYRVTAGEVTSDADIYAPDISDSTVAVLASGAASFSITYALLSDPEVGTISGEVTIGTGASSGAAASAALVFEEALEDGTDFVPGEVIVKFREGLETQSSTSLSVSGVSFDQVRPLSLPRTSLYRAAVLDKRETLELAARLNARPDVVYAHPNYRLEAYATPNDPLFEEQWNLTAINLPEAWDITTGDAVTVAVLDTGILPEHPDLAEKIIPGYDFVSDDAIGDGGGRDPDPTDPGPVFDTDYHGSHVAGIIAASTDNDEGIAGVSWGADVLPVRVLGANGGDLSDIIDGLRWAAGLEVNGVSTNPNPAAVINMSLGGQFRCSNAQVYQDAIDEVRATGAIIVVAAGNASDDPLRYSPAGCSGVITVGATDQEGDRAWYSNNGTRIDVMAPGGDFYTGGIVGPSFEDFSEDYNYLELEGTSMAAPHVAGVVALMKTLQPTITTATALDILTRTARPLSSRACNSVAGAEGCGAGLIDAQAALGELAAAPSPDFALSLTPGNVTVMAGEEAEVTVTLERLNGFDGAVTLALEGATSGISGSFSPASATGNSSTLTLSVASGVSGTFPLRVTGSGAGLSKRADLALLVDAAPVIEIEGAVVRACPIIGSNNNEVDEANCVQLNVGGTGQSAAYGLENLIVRPYRVEAWKDIDGVRSYYGVFSGPVTPTQDGVNITLTPQSARPASER